MHVLWRGPFERGLREIPVPELRGGPHRTLRPVPGSVRPLSLRGVRVHGPMRESVGSVAVTVRVLPSGPEADLEAIKAGIQSAIPGSLREIEERPVAFGITAIVAVAIIDDATGGTDRLEAALADIPGVSSVETVDISLV